MNTTTAIHDAFSLLTSLVAYHRTFRISGELTPAEVTIINGNPRFVSRTFFRWAAPLLKEERFLSSYSAPEVTAKGLFDDAADIWSWVWIVSERWSGRSFSTPSQLRDWLSSQSSTLASLLSNLLVSRDDRSRGEFILSHPLFTLYGLTTGVTQSERSLPPIEQPILWSPEPTIPPLQRYSTVNSVVREAFRRGVIPGVPLEDPMEIFGYRFPGIQVETIGRLLLVLLSLDEGSTMDEAFDGLSTNELRMPLWCVWNPLWSQGFQSIKVWAAYPEWQSLPVADQIQNWIDYLEEEGNKLRQKWGDLYLHSTVEV
jgi:hypothetical protein